ncbi:MAG TPA: hypothetical protein DIW37_04930 [Chryseobacterium sp.]|nr:hypothetical protein [Chryseobacterium sp.]
MFYIFGVLWRSCATCGKPNAISGGSKQVCFTFPEYSGGLAQLAGNQMQLEEVPNKVVLHFLQTPEVSRSLRETKCIFRLY